MEGVLDRLKARMEEGDDEAVTIGDAVEAIGTRGFGPVFLALALLVASPFGGIPTVPTIFAAMLAILAGQMVIGRQSLYVPGIFARREVPGKRVAKGVDWLRPIAQRMDRWFGRRLVVMTSDPARRLAGVVIMALCVTVPPLEFVPFASAIPMTGIALFGLAITARDGLLMMLAFAAAAAALIGGPWLLLSN
ncbi:exopolysaccharide synthesis exoD [Roseivivax marinus]|uniref:Exopolysaccharide synthesis exoD n=1 Tax=Roseivivax marinus TaxID=1379903 RepID=W4HF40_9RHOB|nr:exopolysaccharide synthesis exoD [Roseivivax marinus]